MTTECAAAAAGGLFLGCFLMFLLVVFLRLIERKRDHASEREPYGDYPHVPTRNP